MIVTMTGASRCANAVSSAGTRAIAPPRTPRASPADSGRPSAGRMDIRPAVARTSDGPAIVGIDRVTGTVGGIVSATFWNEAIETLSAPDVRRLEDDRLAEQIAYDYATSPFYRARLDAAGVRPDEVRHARGPRADPVHGEDRDRRVAGGRRAPRRQPVRAARGDRPDPGDRRDDRPADADRADPARYRRLRRDGRAGAVDDGLSPGRHRLRVHELQPVLGRASATT